MLYAWRSEIFWLVLITLGVVFLARLTGDWSLALWIGTLGYLIRHLFFANRLLRWLRRGKSSQLPAGDGVWEEIYYLIFRVRRRNKHRKKQLLKMLDRFRTATAALPDATVLLGSRNEIEWFNDSAATVLGLRRSDVGQQINNLVRSPSFSRYLQGIDEALTIAMPSPVDDARELEVRIVPYGDEHSRLLVGRDVTQLRRMERVRSDFVANVSHELRTPLTVLRGYIEACNDSSAELPDSVRRMFRRIEEQASRMQNLIDGLLVLTRLESTGASHAQHRVQIGPLLESVCEDVMLMTENGPELRLSLDSEAEILGVEQELRSAFSNLVVNAMKFTPETGTVDVRWMDEDSGGAQLAVKDTGPGISRDHLARLTERFYRVDVDGARSKVGCGLGLAIVKHALGRHDASLIINSTVGHGSCFTCCFPPTRVYRTVAATPQRDTAEGSVDEFNANSAGAGGEGPGTR